jgi:hypothetical protein
MSHYPTSFFILDNEELGTCWIGQTKMRLDTNGRSLLPHISREQLVDKLATKYEEYSYPCLEVERVKKDGTYLFYGLEQWITKLKCEIKRKPLKAHENSTSFSQQVGVKETTLPIQPYTYYELIKHERV